MQGSSRNSVQQKQEAEGISRATGKKILGREPCSKPGEALRKLELKQRTDDSKTTRSKGHKIDYMMCLALLGGI